MLVVSWNILSDIWLTDMYKHIDKKYLYFDYRKKRINDILKKINSDVILLQEVDYKSYTYLFKLYSKKYWISKLSNIDWCNEDDSDSCNMTGNLILIKHSFIDKNEIPNEIKYNMSKNRVCLIVNTNKYLFVNVHLSTTTETKRINEIKTILKHIKKYKDKKIIIGGDFNNDILETQKLDNLLQKNGYNRTIIKNKPTYILDKHESIDFIYYRNTDMKNIRNIDLSIKKYKNKTDLENLTFKFIGSDHLPIISKFTII